MRTSLKILALVFMFISTSSFTVYSQGDVYALGDDKHLPISSTSEAAKNALSEAIKCIHNADLACYSEKMDEAVAADPNFFMAHAYRALGEASDKESDKVDEYFDQTLALPQDQLTPAEQTIRQIIVKLDEEKPDEVKPLLDQLVTTYPANPQAYEIASDISRFILGNQEDGFTYIQKLVEVEPNHASAYNTMGYYYMDKKEMDKAKEAFEKYLSLAPEEPNAHDSMGDYFMAVADYDKSAEHYNKAVAMGMEVSKVKADRATALADDEDEDPNTDFESDTLNNADPE